MTDYFAGFESPVYAREPDELGVKPTLCYHQLTLQLVYIIYVYSYFINDLSRYVLCY